MSEKLSISDSSLDAQKAWIENYQFGPRIIEVGKVISIGDGIVWIEGLPSASIDEVVYLEDGSRAMVFHLTEKLIGAILLEQTGRLSAGMLAENASRKLSIPTGDGLIGRIIDPLGVPLDGKQTPVCDSSMPLEAKSPPIIARDFVRNPLLSGNKIIDTLIPIGKGQRQLLIGDNGLGKSSLAMDVVVNQKDKNVLCIYVLIAQKRSSVVRTIELLTNSGALNYSVIVVAEATSLAGLQYLAPFAGCAIAEFWMNQGRDTLIIYDDLSAHANSYRELSLLLRRPPGREAFPADIFFLHSRLLERSTKLASKYGAGSMTALPIIETKEGEIASYIPTNLISITDGQIYFSSKNFSAGFLPAIDITRSVSRVGGKAQPPEIKKEAGRMKLDYLQFLELEVFTRFGARLEASVQKKIQRGQRLRELLKQERLRPLSFIQQLAWLLAFNRGLFDQFEPSKVRQKQAELLNFVSSYAGSALDAVVDWAKEQAITLDQSVPHE